ncbi:MAG TPA: hypothetical protein VKR55_16885 [Bradyrhizobium sp.]|uniref:hypothetical protein n=1 Tax=Bradyrhizobium sp. TaxID=376 RepID=UPI002B795CA6|nr:hypothetical protein [Bradyrhizobium sp.]HLZ03810.1 hypothetical protein [Bradyrhizobium sp.]
MRTFTRRDAAFADAARHARAEQESRATTGFLDTAKFDRLAQPDHRALIAAPTPEKYGA